MLVNHSSQNKFSDIPWDFRNLLGFFRQYKGFLIRQFFMGFLWDFLGFSGQSTFPNSIIFAWIFWDFCLDFRLLLSDFLGFFSVFWDFLSKAFFMGFWFLLTKMINSALLVQSFTKWAFGHFLHFSNKSQHKNMDLIDRHPCN